MPKRIARTRKDGHVHARDDDDEGLLLDALPPRKKAKPTPSQAVDGAMDVDEPETTQAKATQKTQKTQKVDG